MKQFKRDENQNSNKLHLDKYYTSKELAEYCINKTFEIIGRGNIKEIIEPSAGNGSFSNQIENCIAYDIEPEDNNIIKQNFLELDLDYKKGRLIIGNPPYGARNNLAKQFYKKSIQIADYIAFILPISQYKNNVELYDFDLIYSENLGSKYYSDREVHCCFNIYQRPESGLNKRKYIELKDVSVLKYHRNRELTHLKTSYEIYKYDMRICGFGASIGKEVEYEGQYASEFVIRVNNTFYKEKILWLLKHIDWKKQYYMTATPNLCAWQIYKYIKEQIPEIN